jgi:hypothetical protein
MTLTLPFPPLDTILHLIALGGWLVCLVLLVRIRATCVSLSRHVHTVQRSSQLARYRQWLRDADLRPSSGPAQAEPTAGESLLMHDGVIDVDAYLHEARKGDHS